MQGRPVFQPIDLQDVKLNRLQANLADYLADLGDEVESLRAPLVLLTGRDAQIGEELFVEYRGSGGHDIKLPPAALRGTGRAALIHVVNNGTGSCRLTSVGKDTLDGGRARTIQVGEFVLAAGNGDRAWNSLRSSTGSIIASSATCNPADNFAATAPTPAPVVQAPWFSIVDSANFFFGQASTNIRSNSGNFTTGDKFSTSRALVVTGVRFFWKSPGSNKTIRVRLYEKSVSVATVDVAVTSSGVYTGTFSSPYTLLPYQDYAATTWETTGTNYTDILADGVSTPFFAEPIVGMISTGPFTITRSFKRFAAGDVVPGSTSSGALFPVEPIFDPFSLV